MAGPTSLLSPVVGEVFFLTSPFIERGYRTSGNRSDFSLSGKATYRGVRLKLG